MNNKVYIPWAEVFNRLSLYDHPENSIYGVPTGGMLVAGFLKSAKVVIAPEEANTILDDIIDSGNTRSFYRSLYPNKAFVALFDKLKEDWLKEKWVVFPWEKDKPNGEENIQQNIVRLLQYIGEDPNREGLLKTPERVKKAWDYIFSGYLQDPKDLVTTFNADGYDEIVLLKNIELYSMCEHHILPFFGKAHVAYIPDKRIIGISKLARLVDIFARRLQIQERIGNQVTEVLMKYLQPKGAACIIEATHMCTRMRGVEKQNSVMVTSSMRGVFLQEHSARQELMGLIRSNDR